MKFRVSLVLLAVLLCGCGQKPVAPTDLTTPTVSDDPQPTTVQTEPEAPLEPLTAYSVPDSYAESFCFMGDTLIFAETTWTFLEDFGEQASTTLTRLDGLEDPTPEQVTFPGLFSLQESTTVVSQNSLAFWDWDAMEYVLLDSALQVTDRISLPQEPNGAPYMTPDFSTVYYCTDSGLWALDSKTEEIRHLADAPEPFQSLSSLLFDGSVVSCYTETGAQLFYDGTTGELLNSSTSYLELATWDNTFFWTQYDEVFHLLFGQLDDPEIRELYPAGDVFPVPLPTLGGVLTEEFGEEAYLLDFYDLSTGRRSASVQLPSGVVPFCYQAQGNAVWFLNNDGKTLYRWDLTASDPEDPAIYTNRRFTESDPNLEGLALIAQQAQALGQAYDVEILVWEDAVNLDPWDYDLMLAYHVPLYQKSLGILEEVLSQFPEGMLRQAVNWGKPLIIGLVQQIYGSHDQALGSAGGLEFEKDGRLCIVLSMEDNVEANLYHELEHVIDDYIFNKTSYLDDWASLNPDGFVYDYDYTQYESVMDDRWDYLEGDSQAFIDRYSMTFPKEDRARLFEYAVQPGSAFQFQSDRMQEKLSVLCQAIRDTFRLDPELPLLWEQHLK